jgi:hypothetical protein
MRNLPLAGHRDEDHHNGQDEHGAQPGNDGPYGSHCRCLCIIKFPPWQVPSCHSAAT